MKLLTTKKAIKNNYDTIVSVGYARLQFLLNNVNPFGYSTRAEGWACDYYDINGICICTGYAPVDGKTVLHPDYDISKKYDDAARIILHEESDFATATKKLDALLSEFLQEVGAMYELV